MSQEVERPLVPVRTLAGWEYRCSVRTRWIVVMATTFALLCLVVTIAAFRSVRGLGLAGIGPASASLVNLGILLPSLMGLLLGASTLSGSRDDGFLGLVAVQPLRRTSIVTGTFLGLTRAIWTTLGIGFGVAMVVMATVAQASDVPALVTLVLATAAVAAVCVALGVALAASTSSRTQAVAAAVGVWIVAALGVDLAIAALAPSLHLGPGGLLAVVLLNPLEAGRILALLGTNLQGTALGPFGAYLLSTFGTAGSVALLVGDLIAWTVVPLVVADRVLARRDL